jgi:hypothetical protein
MHLRLCMHEDFYLIINALKYRCETYQIFICPFRKIMMNSNCNSWIMDLTMLIMNDSIHVQMLTIENMWKNSVTYSSINVGH